MSDRVQKILQVIVFVLGSVLSLMGANKKSQVEVSAASGAYSTPAEAAGDVAAAGNMQTAGMAALLTTVIIPFVFQFIGGWFGGKPVKPGYVAVADRSACETLLLTRAAIPLDIAKVKELIASGVQLEVDQRVEAVTKKAGI